MCVLAAMTPHAEELVKDDLIVFGFCVLLLVAGVVWIWTMWPQ